LRPAAAVVAAEAAVPVEVLALARVPAEAAVGRAMGMAMAGVADQAAEAAVSE
jgi:hypothetical protein